MTRKYSIRYGHLDSKIIKTDCPYTQNHVDSRNRQDGFFDELEKSILENGFQNPIPVLAIKGRVKARDGNSRLWVAQKHNIAIPCIIEDHSNMYSDFELLKFKKDIRSKYKNKPAIIEMRYNMLIIKK
jgi:hypothetical protein